MVFNLIYIKKPPVEGGDKQSKMEMVCGYHTAPLLMPCKGSPHYWGINEVKLGTVCGYHATSIICAAKKNPPPNDWGGKMKRNRGSVKTTP